MNAIFYHPNCFYFTEDLAGLDVIWPKEVRDIMSEQRFSRQRQKKRGAENGLQGGKWVLPTKTNMSPKNQWLEDVGPIDIVPF